MARKVFDITIVGGGVMGASIAYHLLKEGFRGDLAIVERDPSYQFATTPRSAGGIRQQFSTEINIRIGLFSLERFLGFEEEMEVGGERACIDFRQRGYLFLGDQRNWESLRRQIVLQRALGVDVQELSPQEVRDLIPELSVDGLLGASWGPRAGYLDPHGVLWGYLRKAKDLGATYVHAEVARLLRKGTRIWGIETAEGEVMESGTVVLAAGAWSGEISKTAGVEIPVVPVPRMAFCFDPKDKLSYPLPMVIDPEDLYLRHETGGTVLTGKPKDERPGFRFEWDGEFFTHTIWPCVAKWVPSFESLRLLRGWAGLYEMCTWDRNGLVGPYPGLEGLVVATGFSGHGLQQAPAVGQCVAELILYGHYISLDLSPLEVGRILQGVKIQEEGIV